MTKGDRCPKCGQPWEKHERDRDGALTKCPVLREEKHTPPQEHRRTPSGDY